MRNLSYFKENSQELRNFLIGGLLFSAPRLFWETIDRRHFPLSNPFLKRALVAAANQKEKNLLLLKQDSFSPLALTRKSRCNLKCSPQSYFRKGLNQLKLKKLPPFSLVTPKKSSLSPLIRRLKKTWEKDLGIECQINAPNPYQVVFTEWNGSFQDPLFTLDAFKKATDKLKPEGNKWEHPGYQSLFEKAKLETDPQKRRDLIECLEELVLQNLSILPLFYGELD